MPPRISRRVFEADTDPTAIFRNELNPRLLQRVADARKCCLSKVISSFQTDNGLCRDACRFCKVYDSPSQRGASHLALN